eukprot:6210010-Pleurochrysis_carterae.AAC.6
MRNWELEVQTAQDHGQKRKSNTSTLITNICRHAIYFVCRSAILKSGKSYLIFKYFSARWRCRWDSGIDELDCGGEGEGIGRDREKHRHIEAAA